MSKWTRVINAALLLAVALLLVAVVGGLRRRSAEAQMVFQAGPVIVVSGAQSGSNSERPFYLLDTTTQCLLVYTYQPQENYMRLAAGRKVIDDLQIEEYDNKGMTVDQVKKMLEKIKTK